MRKIQIPLFFLLLILFTIRNVHAQCEELEERINVLEKKIAKLEKEMNITPEPPSPQTQTTPAFRENQTYPVVRPEPVSTTGQHVGKRVITQVESISNVLKSRALEKDVLSAGRGKGISLLIAYTNIGRKDIVSFKGTISLEDGSGDLLTSYFIDIHLGIPSLESKSSFTEVPYSAAYSAGYRRLFTMKVEEIKTSLNLTEIVFSDGTVRTK